MFLEKRELPQDNAEARQVSAAEHQYVMDDGLLRRVVWTTLGKLRSLSTPLVVPEVKVPEVLDMMHDSVMFGAHMGVERTMAKLRARFWWPGMYKDVRAYIASCDKCQRHKMTAKGKSLIGGHPMGAAPFDLVACDLMAMPVSAEGNRYVLVVVDYFTRFATAVALRDKTAATVAEALVVKVFLIHGPPRRLLTDNGSEFRNELLDEVCGYLKTKKFYTSPYHPQTDGVVERLNQTILKMLKVYVREDQQDWDKLLPYVLFAHNMTKTDATGVSPYKALCGRDCLTSLELKLEPSLTTLQGRSAAVAWSEIHSNLEELAAWMVEFQADKKGREEKSANRGRKSPLVLVQGTVVWIANNRAPAEGQKPKLLPHYRGPYVVQHMVGKVAVRLRRLVSSGNTTTIHVDNVKLFKGVDGKPVILDKWHRQCDGGPAVDETCDEGEKQTFEVESIVSHEIRDGAFYLGVKWKGYPDVTIEDEYDCDCHDLVERYFDGNRANAVRSAALKPPPVL